VTRVFRLPPVELSGRVNLWWGLVFVLEFLVALVRGSLTVAWQVFDFRRQPGAAVIAVPLRVDDDLIMTHTAVTASLIPGSLIIDADRDRRILYLHIIGVRSDQDVEHQRESILLWEERIVRACLDAGGLEAMFCTTDFYVDGLEGESSMACVQLLRDIVRKNLETGETGLTH